MAAVNIANGRGFRGCRPRGGATMAVKRTKPKRPRDPRPSSAKTKTIEPGSIVGLHSAVPADIASNLAII